MSSTARRQSGAIATVASLCLLASGLAGAQNPPTPEAYATPNQLTSHLDAKEWGGTEGEVVDGDCCADYGDFESCQCCGPTWTITADALWLHRDAPQGYTILSDANTGAEILNASQMGLGTHAGPRLILLRELASGWMLDLEYFGIDGWSTTDEFGPGQFLLTGDQSRTGPDGVRESLLYASQLRTAEINLRAPGLGWLRPLAGFRWIGLNETYQANGAFDFGAGEIPYLLRYETRNNLYGGQIGAAASLWDEGGPFTLSALGKAGLYLADVQNSGSFRASFETESLAFDGKGHGQRAAFFGELGIIAGWRINDNLAIRGGYQLYWLTDVALAIEQPLSTDVATGTGGFGTSDIFMHGPSAGLELSW